MRYDDPRLQTFLAHRAALIDYATPIVGCRMRAEDLVQEAYLRFVPSDDSGTAVRQPVSYLYRIVRNLALDWLRSVSAEARREQAQIMLTDRAHTAPSPEEVAEGRDRLHRVDAALAELPDKVRLAFEMNRLGGHTFAQIAVRLGVSTATAGRWAQQALQHVAKRLQESDG